MVDFMSVKKFLVNLACGFIPSKSVRHRVRVRAQFDIKSYIDFAVRDAGLVRPTVRTYQGHNGMKKIIVVLNNTVAYKFPLVDARADSPRREKCSQTRFAMCRQCGCRKWNCCNFAEWMY